MPDRRGARVAALLLGLCASAAVAAPAPRFPHAAHAKERCVSCHEMSAANGFVAPYPVASGARGHEPCSGCHEHEAMWKPPFPERKRRLAFCAGCHPAGGTDYSRALYPPHRAREAREHQLARFDHGAHLAGSRCEDCHAAAGRERAMPTHASCASSACHGAAKEPRMERCEGCHVATAASAPPLASRVAGPYRTGERFSHAVHAKKSPRDACAGCHGEVAPGPGGVVPLPKMIACEPCHDGEQAFYALGTSCARCHSGLAPASSSPVAASEFRHGAHEVADCASCHRADADGRLRFPVPDDHRPCASCHQHQAEFRTRGAKICGSCHAHGEPATPNPVRGRFRERSEFVVGLGHDRHTAVGCDACHPAQAGREAAAPAPTPAELAPAHRRCAGCHAVEHPPRMGECGACHGPARPAEPRDAWRVSARFAHETHRADVRSAPVTAPAARGWARVEGGAAAPLGCASCHAAVAGAAHGSAIPRPTMKGCADCHDGTWAFKTTGTSCFSCHGPVERG